MVNVHLFHDASNLVACNSSPSAYAANREIAFRYVIKKISDNRHATVPFFLFGDFNFRLDTRSLVEHLSNEGEECKVRNVRSDEVEKIIWKEKDNDRKVLLEIKDKLFRYLHQADLVKNNGRELLKYDKEVTAFHDVIRERSITFPPSYPYSEDWTEPAQYMNTRCPAWCDRILMSHTAHKLARAREGGGSIAYNTIGPHVCMGDHKPVYLSILLDMGNH